MAETAARQEQEKLPEKKVSPKALTRLGHAKDAIAVTKQVLSFGADNQVEAIRATQMNSRFRLQAIRNPSYWELAPQIRHLASQYPDALVAAKADLVHGGNCGEHAYIAYDYLRQKVSGERIQYAASEIDHAFVFIGDFRAEPSSEVAVADPWPTQATACLWEDHFCLGTKVTLRHDAVADGKSIKGAIAAGLRLSQAGQQAASQRATQAETNSAIADWKANHFWNQPNTTADGAKYNYVSDKPATTVK